MAYKQINIVKYIYCNILPKLNSGNRPKFNIFMLELVTTGVRIWSSVVIAEGRGLDFRF